MMIEVRTATGRNQLLLIGFCMLQLLQLVLIPVVLLPQDSAWGLLLLPPLLFSNSWWAFIHELIHDHLFSNRFLGQVVGRVQGILYGVSFDLLRCGHMLHHAYSRTQRERTEVYTVGEDSRIAATIGHYFRLFGGLYIFEVLGSLIFLMPAFLIRRFEKYIASADNVVEPLTQRLIAPQLLGKVRIDAMAILIVYAFSLYWYGAYWWMLALALWGRGLLVSMMDNAFHYGTPLEQPRYAHNLAVPAWWGRLLLNFNLHGLHHQHPAVPWHELPRLHQGQASAFQGRLFPAILSQLRGPIPEHRLRNE